jgi:hypothetical protein
MLDKIFNPFTLLAGPILVGVFASLQEKRAGPTNPPLPAWNIIISYIVWLLFTRFFKLIPHFVRRPLDVWALPAWLVFNYYFAIMKLYALFTLHKVAWGTRAGIGTELAADIGAEEDIDEKTDTQDNEKEDGSCMKIKMTEVEWKQGTFEEVNITKHPEQAITVHQA